MEVEFNKDKIKQSISDEQVFQFLKEHGGEPIWRGENIVSRTICHNHPEDECSYKLYYYTNTKLFKCYTGCEETGGYDIFDLVRKIYRLKNVDMSLYDAELFIINYFCFEIVGDFYKNRTSIDDFAILSKYEGNMQGSTQQKSVALKIYDEKILKNFPFKRIGSWEREGITEEVMRARGIKFDPKEFGIIIPHYNINNELVGIRERTLIKDLEVYGKYRPAILNGKMYNHPLGFNLYNLNNSKENIKLIKKAIIFEGEKGCLMYSSLFGIDNDISVACCGSSLISQQFNLLYQLGVEEIIIAFDKQFKETGDEEWKRWTKKLESLNKKYAPFVKVSYMFDKEDLLGYKDSPIDKGADVFMNLFEKRFSI